MLSSSESSSTSLFLLFPRHALKAYLSGPITGEGARGWWRLRVQQGAGGPSLPSQSGEPSWAGPGRAGDGGRGQPQPGHPQALAGKADPGSGQEGSRARQPRWQQPSKEASPCLGALPPSPRGWPPGCACYHRTAFLFCKGGHRDFCLWGISAGGERKKKVDSMHLLFRLENVTSNNHAAELVH